MQKILTVKGTNDLFGVEILSHDKIINLFESLCKFFNFEKIATPILEHSNVFSKSLGITSDIISKEMYSFKDQGGDQLVLRPEGTAAIVRSIISNSMQDNLIHKYFYSGPMFRREKPQAGRLRQFHQIGVEFLGNHEYHLDIEVIMLAEKLMEFLGIRNKLKLEINTLGSSSSRKQYTVALKEYFNLKKTSLSDENKKRLNLNPLRILDSKNEEDRSIIQSAPKIFDFLDDESKAFFNKILSTLENLNIDFKINPFLVRGLDYYNHTTFEYITNENKSQNAVLAGGRYDGLMKSLGGKDISGVGWAAGIERICLNIQKCSNLKKTICLLSTSENNNNDLIKILNNIIVKDSFSINLLCSGNFKKKLNKANKINSMGCIILGDKEWEDRNLIWKDFNTGKQETFSLTNINDFISNKISLEI